jgi:hypothetical protein
MDWRRARIGLILISIAVIAYGLLVIPRLGVDVDGAVSAGCYERSMPLYSWQIAGNQVPVMMMAYVGAVEAWMYCGVFRLVPPSSISLRLPTLLLTVASLWLFFGFLNQTVNRRTAWIGTLLLAADPSYLLIDGLDFGSLTVHFVFKIAALILIVKFHRSNDRLLLASAFFLFGLAMWEKVIFAWALVGFAIATVAVFPRECRQHLSLKNLGIAASAMILGSLPLIIFNIDRPLETFRGQVRTGSLEISSKYNMLTQTVDGSVLFGFMTAFDAGPVPGKPKHWYETASVAISGMLGQPHHNLNLLAIAAAALSLVAIWKTSARQPIVFALIASFVTWLCMVGTVGAGTGAHHVIFLWPFPVMMIAAAIDRIPTRVGVAAITLALCASSAAVVNQFYVELIRNGPSTRFTDAMNPLHQHLATLQAPRIYAADWGFVESLQLLSEGTLPILYADVSSDQTIDAMLNDPGCVFVAHASSMTFLPATRAALEQFAQREHYQQEPIATIVDRNGRPTFDIFRFRKLHL